jgi:hypothetical protein
MARSARCLARLLLVGAGASIAGCDRAEAPLEESALLVDRAWTSADPAAPLGVLRIFLSDGTLVQDSCFETHRLSRWSASADGRTLRWNEDGADIRADVAELTPQTLVLQLQLVDGVREQRYVAAAVPYVCPDAPR